MSPLEALLFLFEMIWDLYLAIKAVPYQEPELRAIVDFVLKLVINGR